MIRLLSFLAVVLTLNHVLVSRGDDWPQWLGPKRDGVWRESGIVDRFPTNGLPVRWRTPLGGGYSGPSVSKGRVYIMDRHVARNATKPANSFARGAIAGDEGVLCLDAATGTLLWQHRYECAYTVSYPGGPRATPICQDGKLYTLGAEGALLCFDAASGKILWSRDFKKDFGAPTPVWGFAAHPLLLGRQLICLVGGSNSVAVSFDKDSGQELWRALSAKEPGYAPPTLIHAAGKPQLIIWHPESVNALDPDTGKLYWSIPFTARSGLSVPTPRQDGERLFVTSFYEGGLMLKLGADQPGATVLWRGKKQSERDTDTLHSIMPTPFIDDGHIYGICSYGQLRCLKAATGERVWETLEATTESRKETRWACAFLTKHQERYFLFNELGELILARLSPAEYEEISRTKLIEPTSPDPGRLVVWSHPAYANRCIYVRNDKELLCASLAKNP